MHTNKPQNTKNKHMNNTLELDQYELQSIIGGADPITETIVNAIYSYVISASLDGISEGFNNATPAASFQAGYNSVAVLY